MKKTVYLSILIPLLFISVTCFGQGEFLQNDKSGIGFGGNFSIGKNASIYGGEFGFSINGLFDLQLGIGRLSIPEVNWDKDVKGSIFSPGLAIFILKQREGVPISLKASAFFGIYDYENDRYINAILTSRTYNASLGLYHRAKIGDKGSVIPSLDAIYTNATGVYTNFQGESVEDYHKFVTVIFSLPFVIELPKENVIYLTPQVGYGNKTTAFGFSIGTVFAFKMDLEPKTDDYDR